MQRSAENLLKTYLGARTGEGVLAGRTKRGEGEKIHAVVWLCDLRDWTRLAEAIPVEDFFRSQNDFFDCTAGAVEHGGEILSYRVTRCSRSSPSVAPGGRSATLGVPQRMQFTVIGAAANEAAHLAGICKVLERWV
jgi:class 3 adenylate cyclase